MESRFVCTAIAKSMDDGLAFASDQSHDKNYMEPCMSYKPLAPCAYPGCIGLAPEGERYCAAHKPAMQLSEQDRRGTSAKRGYGNRWRRLRLMVPSRDPICRHPGCNQPSTDVDHIVSKAQGGTDSMDNLQGLCHAHHSAKTAREDGGFGNAQTRRDMP